tara:strand:+ start:279 stop:806 length:528 start_codon:yes stop_codon:yes gene_type:complete
LSAVQAREGQPFNIGENMSVLKRLQSLKLSDDAMITLTREEGTDVFVHNETEVEDAMNETSVIYDFASLIADTKLDARNRWNGNIIEHLRENDFLDDYERGSFAFEDFLAETLTENFYDTELIEYSTEKYDHKRGFTTLTAQVEIPYANFMEVGPFVSGWTVSVETENGTLSFDA